MLKEPGVIVSRLFFLKPDQKTAHIFLINFGDLSDFLGDDPSLEKQNIPISHILAPPHTLGGGGECQGESRILPIKVNDYDVTIQNKIRKHSCRRLKNDDLNDCHNENAKSSIEMCAYIKL